MSAKQNCSATGCAEMPTWSVRLAERLTDPGAYSKSKLYRADKHKKRELAGVTKGIFTVALTGMTRFALS